jgi:lysylphosphatidylglycerol synthetase-like protein (DUF2156 family)
MNKRPVSVSVTLLFILLNALIWLTLGVVIAVNIHPGIQSVPPTVKGVMAGLSFAAAAVLLVLCILLAKRIRVAWYAAILALVVSASLSIFDDFGWSDLIMLVINLVPIILLVKERAWFLQANLAHAPVGPVD